MCKIVRFKIKFGYFDIKAGVKNFCFIDWAPMQENPTLFHANNKGTDQPVHLHSLISTIVICYLEIIVVNLLHANFNIVASLAEQAGLNVTWADIL